MARHLAWVLTAALAYCAPASASTLCGHEAADLEQGDAQGGAQANDRDASHRPPGKDEHRPWKFWQGDSKVQLGITNQQSGEIEQIFQANLPKLEAAKDKIDKLEATLSQTIKDNTADLATVAQQVDRLEAARADLYKTRTLMLYRMRGVLSAEQRVKLQAAWEASRPKGNDPAVRR
jgi:Spy/CpxP family protein refolding chaperone